MTGSALGSSSPSPKSRVRVSRGWSLWLYALISMRPADYPELRAAAQDRPLVVGAMSQKQLREAIIYPARAVGLDLEPGLVELLLHDMGGTARGDVHGDDRDNADD